MAKNSVSNNGKPRKSIDDMNFEEITAYNMELMAKLQRLLADRAPKSQPQAQAEPVAKLPTKRMVKRLATFDNMTDSEQVNSLRAMW